MKFKNESNIENIEHTDSNIRGKRSKIIKFYYSDGDKYKRGRILSKINT